MRFLIFTLSILGFAQSIDYTDLKNKPTLHYKSATDYKFTRTNGSGASGDLSSSGAGKTITFTPCPKGIAGSNSRHYLYLSGGTGTAETVLIIGGTCTSAAATGTVIFDTSNSHSGAWQLTSATAGITEAINSVSTNLKVAVPPGVQEIYGSIPLYSRSLILVGEGGSTYGNTTEGTVIHSNSTSNIFSVGASAGDINDVQFTFQDITFDGGDTSSRLVQFKGLTTNIKNSWENCNFINFNGTVFEFGTSDTVNESNTYLNFFKNCTFFDVGIGIITHTDSELIAEGNFFWRYDTRAIEVHANNNKITSNYFQNNTTTDEDILIVPTANVYSGGQIGTTIAFNKFGNEEATVDEVRVKIRVGTIALKASHPDWGIAGLMIQGNSFYGSPGTATACITLHSPLYTSIISENTFLNSKYAVDESGMDETSASGGNLFYGNSFFSGVNAFKSGGKGFSYIEGTNSGLKYSISQDTIPPVQNLIQYSYDFENVQWNKNNLTAACAQSDPIGTSLACTLTKTATSGYTVHIFTPTVTGPHVLSVFLKSGTLTDATLEFGLTSGDVTYGRYYVSVSSDWQRLSLRAPSLNSGTSYYFRIYPGINSSATTGTINVFGAQVNGSNTVAGYVATNGATISSGYGNASSRFYTPTLEITNGITSSSGVKHFRTASTCTTAASIGATCNSTFSLPGTAFADTNYTLVCSMNGVVTGAPVLGSVYASAGNQFQIQLIATSAVASQGAALACIAIHD